MGRGEGGTPADPYLAGWLVVGGPASNGLHGERRPSGASSAGVHGKLYASYWQLLTYYGTMVYGHLLSNFTTCTYLVVSKQLAMVPGESI